MKFIKQVLLNAVIGALFGAVLIGLLGFLAAGSAGIWNGAVLGAIFGFVGGMSMVGLVGGTYWWTGIFSRYGEHYQKKERGEE